MTGSTEYTVTDPGTTLSSVRCTDTDWSEGRPVQPSLDANTGALTWTVDSTDTVCRVRLTSTSTTGTAQNVATVNGVDHTATAQATALGSGQVTGAANPTPSATASSPSTTDVPTDTATDTATDTTSNAAPSASQPQLTVTAGGSTTTTTPRNPQLARTGLAAGSVALVAIVLTAAGGAGLYIVRRRA
ncbi:MAG: LPXTG cell wall anchor domain-containing protein [Actinomyces sp.]|uniref:LPXTG cell wall anchor domain-containing protein n=1 Tax=Actinomyces sp. TaxID=29317 RepID=UPI0026DAA85A|nr:LPXTG cell wall anchor domain-containing protein [Actinomyces sp.]MDO4242523.1 LPXTG cell wall anchor domain-containing protein [Actinomyces sp.]